MSTNNGANNNVEDILASIRSSISDEGGFRVHQGNAQAVPLRRDIPVAEEAAEFELPSIFKPAPPQPVKPNILGRLSEALKSADPDVDRSRTVVRFEPAGGHRMIEPPAASRQAFGPTPVPTPPPREPNADDAAEKAQHANDGMARVMTSFFDTRLNRMGELSSQRPDEEMARPPMQPEAMPMPPAPAPTAYAPPAPPRLPNYAATETGVGDPIEDAAALLLRPMLKQWLTENMPKIVERALRNESETAPPSQQQPQQPTSPFEIRKTLR